MIFSDLSDVPENLPLPAPGSESPQALNYSQIASAAVAVSQGGQDPSVSSTETLLRNIQGLLKVAADNARQQERQINYEKGQWHDFLNTSLTEAVLQQFHYLPALAISPINPKSLNYVRQAVSILGIIIEMYYFRFNGRIINVRLNTVLLLFGL